MNKNEVTISALPRKRRGEGEGQEGRGKLLGQASWRVGLAHEGL